MDWPASAEELVAEQERLAAARPPPWRPAPAGFSVGGCFICFPRRRPGPGARGDPCWAAAAVRSPAGRWATVTVSSRAGHPYEAGLLALREGAALAAAVRRLPTAPDVLLVNATGRDHPRRAGLALHLGAVLGLPTVGVTHRPLRAVGDWPQPGRGAWAPLRLAGVEVGRWLCTRGGARPLAVHAAWRTDPETAATIVLAAAGGRRRTPEPIRRARQAARRARTADSPRRPD